MKKKLLAAVATCFILGTSSVYANEQFECFDGGCRGYQHQRVNKNGMKYNEYAFYYETNANTENNFIATLNRVNLSEEQVNRINDIYHAYRIKSRIAQKNNRLAAKDAREELRKLELATTFKEKEVRQVAQKIVDSRYARKKDCAVNKLVRKAKLKNEILNVLTVEQRKDLKKWQTSRRDQKMNYLKKKLEQLQNQSILQ